MTFQADAIRITSLMKRYGNSLAVEDLSLSVPKGSMFGFLGPNGSGKSTTIGCLTGLLEPTSGTVEILGGRFTTESADLKWRIGVMPETLGLFDPLYAHEFLTFVARMYGLQEGEVQQRVKELLTALDLTDNGKILAEFSTGMRKRVSFAAAVIHSPELLFLDEPFESIDPAGWLCLSNGCAVTRKKAARCSSQATYSRPLSVYATAWPSLPSREN